MGLGDIGTILLVVVVAWAGWTFFLSPDAEVSRDIGGGLVGLKTGDEEAVNKMGKRFEGALKGIARDCPMCSTGGGITKNKECQQCVEENRKVIMKDVRAAYGMTY